MSHTHMKAINETEDVTSDEATNGGIASRVVWSNASVTPGMRSSQKNQRPICIWLTGLSGSGKSTLANELEVELHSMNYHTMLLDGDNIRHGLCRDLGMEPSHRTENIRRIAETAKLFCDAGIIVIAAFIAPFRQDRENAKALFAKDSFVEVHVHASLEACEARDPKGLYKLARSGKLANFTGIDSVYEEPERPDIKIDTTKLSPKESVNLILQAVFSERNPQ